MFARRHKKKQDDNVLAVGDVSGDGRVPLIRLRQIVKTYSNAAGEFKVLKGINADLYKGEFVGVIGKSGSGKSTLINMVTGIDRPTSGEVYVGDVPVHELTENQLAEWRGRNLGIIFQFFQLLPTLSLLENVMLPMDFCHMYAPRERKDRAMELLQLVEMEDRANKLPSAVSGGQQQRVAIARSLANDPPILIADEPTGNLDSRTATSIFEMFEGLVSRGKTIVVVTHDTALAKQVSRTMLIADGEIVNDWVFKTLSTLSHQQMLQATKRLDPVRYEPGQALIRQDETADRFFIITSGDVEVALKRHGGPDVVVTRMGPGNYVGEIELMSGGKAIATVRAAETPVEAVALERDTFIALMSESENTRKAIAHIVEERVDENVAARREKL